MGPKRRLDQCGRSFIPIATDLLDQSFLFQKPPRDVFGPLFLLIDLVVQPLHVALADLARKLVQNLPELGVLSKRLLSNHGRRVVGWKEALVVLKNYELERGNAAVRGICVHNIDVTVGDRAIDDSRVQLARPAGRTSDAVGLLQPRPAVRPLEEFRIEAGGQGAALSGQIGNGPDAQTFCLIRAHGEGVGVVETDGIEPDAGGIPGAYALFTASKTRRGSLRECCLRMTS